jgi:type IV fimbrial biogenesis protein FimT
MRHIKAVTGFSLLELLIALAIASIIAAYAAPSFNNLLKEFARRSNTSNLVALINTARHTAIQKQTSVTLCPIDASNTCTKNWKRPVTAFFDPNRNKKIDSNEVIIRQFLPDQSGFLNGKTGIRNYFRFRPSGLAREAIGSIIWCPKDQDNRYASHISINMGGRPRTASDTDGDGIVEDASGKPTSCT